MVLVCRQVPEVVVVSVCRWVPVVEGASCILVPVVEGVSCIWEGKVCGVAMGRDGPRISMVETWEMASSSRGRSWVKVET